MLTSCQACLLFNSQLQSTIPLSKVCRGARKGPLTELNTNVKRQCQKEPKITKRILKSIGEAIYATYNEKCKENFQKSLSDILVLVPKHGLQKKSSPAEKKKKKREMSKGKQTNKKRTRVQNVTKRQCFSPWPSLVL